MKYLSKQIATVGKLWQKPKVKTSKVVTPILLTARPVVT